MHTTSDVNEAARASGHRVLTTATVGRTRGRRCAVLLAMALLGTVAGCSLPEARPDLTRYYLLTASGAATAQPAAESAKRVFFRSVHVPDFLRGKIMQVRLSEHEVRFIDEARWAEPIEAGLARVLREDLERSGAVRVQSRGSDARDFDVSVQVRRCEGVMPAGVARLAARIEVYSTAIDQPLVVHDEFTTDVTGWNGSDYADLAGKLSEAAARLASRIAELLPAPATDTAPNS